MTTSIDIANLAITKIGASTITSFDDTTREAEVLKQTYDYVYEQTLAEKSWNFATKDAELPQDVNTPTDANYNYQFVIPSDYLNVVRVTTTSGAEITDYRIQNGYVFANYSTIVLKYVYKPSVNDLPAWFVKYLVIQLAIEVAEAIVANGSIQSRLANQAVDARLMAYKKDANENIPENALSPSSYLQVRII